ncbi:ankyrin repeat domain-containing protein [Mycena albidolilacea]|uniref:Ankyrin repeat domain-containing protein n=1 Tax=Mycena albidolilacea TaxID=1033008 RepID=A0AAD6YZ50_9AGAR|nr:ankyrin repeat domain-containing protein [Mycena albidolilacea]
MMSLPTVNHYYMHGGVGGSGGPGGGQGGGGGTGEGARVNNHGIHIHSSGPDSNDEIKQKILNWITPLNFFQRQADIFSTWEEGTGEWLLSHPDFKEWESGSGTVLWCRGIPGAGKTVLSSVVVNHLGSNSWNCNTGVACMYLNHKETDVQTPANLLASLWKQLAVDKPLSPAVQALYDHHRPRNTRPTLNEVLGILKAAFADFAKTYLVVDALDEFPEKEHFILLKHLSLLHGVAPSIFITSRPHVSLDPFFPDAQCLEILATDDDIHRYVDTQIDRTRLYKHLMRQPELRDEITSTITENAKGMFLLAKLHTESLATKNTIKAVREALEDLPADLNATYDEAMTRINVQNAEDKKLALKTLTWVVYAERPLTVGELEEALAIEPDASALDVDNVPETSMIVSVCAGLIMVDLTMSVVRLIHYTAQHYFEKIQELQFPDAHTFIASQCLAYLNFTELPKAYGVMRDWAQKHPFTVYSQYFLQHAAKSQGQLELQTNISIFCEKASQWQSLWQLHECSAPWEYTAFPLSPSVFWISVASNLLQITGFLLDQGCDASTIKSSLFTATYYGYLEMTNLLIKFGADVNARGGLYETALQAASAKGHEAVVQLLIDKGADVNAQGGYDGSALQAASAEGHDAVVQLLIDKGADVNAQEGDGTALQVALDGANYTVVRLLIDKGADVNVQGGYYGTVLQTASAHGNEAVVQLLIDKGADVNAQGGHYGTALQAASAHGNEAVVQLLIDKGADVNAQGEYYVTALQAASACGQEGIVQLLINKGADVNAQRERDGTALQAASAKGHEAVVQLLIDKGADVNAPGGRYGTALQAAMMEGYDEIFQVLINNGAIVPQHRRTISAVRKQTLPLPAKMA